MTTITTAQVTSSAPPSAFFARWADMDTWPEWNTDTEWVRRDGPFATGTRGQLKPKGGPKVRFVLDSVVPDRDFVDVEVTLEGPLAPVWNLLLGKGFRASAQPDLDRLAAVCEGR